MVSEATPRPFSGLIVSCWFPHEGDITIPGPDLRPVLVVDILKLGNSEKVVCAYGSAAKSTGVNIPKLQGYQIEVQPSNTSGLKEITRFDFVKRFPLDWSDKWFIPSDCNPTARMGILNASEKAAAIVAKQVADNLIASDPQKKWPRPKVVLKIIRKRKHQFGIESGQK
ncbi:MAG: hypothetical protein NT123_22490 [Proteobacteria bacterium]|nr:hypothetical protein [Pseudomonadota bacterium]